MNVMSRVAAPAGSTRFSAAEFERMMAAGAFEDMWVELVRGEIQRIPPPGNEHSELHTNVILSLGSAVARALLRVELAVELGDDTIVGCDVAMLRAPVSTSGPVPADMIALAVEVAVSSADRDLVLKRQLYAGAGVPTYWVVDAARRVVHVFDRPADGDYAGLSLVRFGEALAVPGTAGTVVVG